MLLCKIELISLKQLRDTQVVVGATKVSAVQFLRDELIRQGVDVDAHETHSTQASEEPKGEGTVKEEVIKSIVSSKVKNSEGGQLIAPTLNKDDQQKFAQLYNQVSQLVSDAKFVVVSKLKSLSAKLIRPQGCGWQHLDVG